MAPEALSRMRRKYITPQQTEDAARAWIEREAKQEWGSGLYRGYTFCGVGWRQGDYGFRVQAFMLDSPIRPNDIMYVDCNKVDDWREYFGPTGTALASNAVLSLKRYIDRAHDKPESFTATAMRCVEAEA